MLNDNAIRLYAGSHPHLSPVELATVLGVSTALILSALGREDAARDRENEKSLERSK